jgi:hypothetical protein
MKTIKLIFALLLIITLNYCSSTSTITSQIKFYKTPELNIISEEEIGETIFTDRYEEINKSIYLNKEIETNWNLTKFKLDRGYYPLSSENNEYFFYTINEYPLKKGFAENKKTGEIKLYADGGYGFITKDYQGIDYVKKDYVNYDKCSSCFRKEFIFNGKSENNLKFIYREYSDNMLRPAFTQELQYDLRDGNIIGFKGLRIEVINANNTSIRYKIIKYFD